MENKIINLTEQRISRAKEDMEKMLVELETFRGETADITLLPKDHPKLIGRGDLALVFELCGGVIGKVVSYFEDREHQNNYSLTGFYVGGSPHSMERTVVSLREMGFDNVLDHVEIERYPRPRKEGTKIVYPCFYHLSPDLRECGKYEVHSVENFPFDKLPNGQALNEQVGTSLARIKSEVESGKYLIEVDKHGTKDKPDEALRHMLIGRINRKTNLGELFFADLDHCVIQRN